TEGPYYAPVRWEESARIRPLLVASLVAGRGAALDSLVATFVREGVVPRQSEDLFRLADDLPESERTALIDDLTGGRGPGVTALTRMAALGGRDITFRTAVARALVAIPLPPDGSAASLHAAAVDPALPADLRAQALAALARVPSALGAARTLDAHASV